MIKVAPPSPKNLSVSQKENLGERKPCKLKSHGRKFIISLAFAGTSAEDKWLACDLLSMYKKLD